MDNRQQRDILDAKVRQLEAEIQKAFEAGYRAGATSCVFADLSEPEIERNLLLAWKSYMGVMT